MYSHGSVEESTVGTSQRSLSGLHASWGREQERFSFSSLRLSTSLFFHSSSYCSLSSKYTAYLSSCSVSSWADPHPPPSHFTSSTRNVLLACSRNSCHLLCCCWLCHHFPCSAASSSLLWFNLPPFWSMDGWTHGYPGMLCRATFFQLWMSKSCKSKRREKRKDSHLHDADITPLWLFSF